MSPHPDSRPPWGAGTRIEGLALPAASPPGGAPDPAGDVDRDDPPLVLVTVEVDPAIAAPGGAVVARVTLQPDPSKQAHWNNEAGDARVTLEAPAGWRLDDPLRSVPNPPEDVSSEPRVFEFRLRAPAGIEGAAGEATLRGHALYFVCEDVTGVCMFRRQDFETPIEARPEAREP